MGMTIAGMVGLRRTGALAKAKLFGAETFVRGCRQLI